MLPASSPPAEAGLVLPVGVTLAERKGFERFALQMGTSPVDDLDWSLLAELQSDARLSYKELSRRVHLSAPAVAERVRRLEDSGVLTGYHAHVDVALAGWSVAALVRMSCYGPRCVLQNPTIRSWRTILEIHRVTGPACCVLKVVGTSMEDFEATIDRLAVAGQPTTMFILSSPLSWNAVRPPAAHED
jgi:Lrp/AsnC family transcriptional regulator, leucine-responsive regulatory protein